MKQFKKILRTFAFAAILGSMVSVATSCKDDGPSSPSTGKISGLVTDENSAPLAGVNVAVSGMEASVTTGADGRYSVIGVSIERHTVTFTKTGYQSTTVTVAASKFENAAKEATANATLINASSKIQGTVTDADNGGAPLAGVTVSISASQTTTSAEDGTYSIENLPETSYTVTFTKTGYTQSTKAVVKADFVGGTATVNVEMGARMVLPGLTLPQIQNARKWYYSDYRGGRNGVDYPHWDWSTDYLCTTDFWGNLEEQNEGTTLRIRNDEADRANPADLNNFDSYVYGSKKITADNKILTLRVRTHNADEAAPASFGVQVVDLSAAEPTSVKVGDTKTHGSGNYATYNFDLSAYIGKEVVIAVGIYRTQTGDYWKQLVIHRIAFAHEAVANTDWIPGEEVRANWKLTKEMVRSNMVNPKTTFTGLSPESGNRDNYYSAYRSWRTVNHFGTEWSFMPLTKDPECFPSEGFLIKCKGGDAVVSTTVPQAYYYGKFAITSATNLFTFKTRNFGGNYTFFKISVVKEDGTIVDLAPFANNATEAVAAADGCWKFKHGNGGATTPEAYAAFQYNLNDYVGQNIVVTIGVFKGEANGDENKLVLFNAEFGQLPT